MEMGCKEGSGSGVGFSKTEHVWARCEGNCPSVWHYFQIAVSSLCGRKVWTCERAQGLLRMQGSCVAFVYIKRKANAASCFLASLHWRLIFGLLHVWLCCRAFKQTYMFASTCVCLNSVSANFPIDRVILHSSLRTRIWCLWRTCTVLWFHSTWDKQMYWRGHAEHRQTGPNATATQAK